MTFQYSVDDHEVDDRYDVPQKKPLFNNKLYVPGDRDGRDGAHDWERMAQHCAEDFDSNHDGWDRKWPVEFHLYEGGLEQSRVTVYKEMEPVFQGKQQAWEPPIVTSKVTQ